MRSLGGVMLRRCMLYHGIQRPSDQRPSRWVRILLYLGITARIHHLIQSQYDDRGHDTNFTLHFDIFVS